MPDDIYNFCQGVDSNTYGYFYNLEIPYPYNDNMIMYFKPLECSLASTLGYSGDADFEAMCVDLETDGKPVIYVNQNYIHFNIFKYAKFENLIFSGIN
jgi:hypothetical protein